MNKHIADPGKVYVCLACGKTAKDRYGSEGGWDESCMLNSEEFEESRLVRGLNGRVTSISEPTTEETKG